MPPFVIKHIPTVAVFLGLLAIGFFAYNWAFGHKLIVGPNQIGVHWTSPGLPPTVYDKPGRYSVIGGKAFVHNNVPVPFGRRFEVVDKGMSEWFVDVQFDWKVSNPVRFFNSYIDDVAFSRAAEQHIQAVLNSVVAEMTTTNVQRNSTKIAGVVADVLDDFPVTFTDLKMSIQTKTPVKLH